MTYSTTITSKGQVTIPVAIRRKLDLKPGEAVRFSVQQNGQVTVQKNDWKKQLEQLHQDVAKHLKARGIQPLTDKQLDDLIDDETERVLSTKHGKQQS